MGRKRYVDIQKDEVTKDLLLTMVIGGILFGTAVIDHCQNMPLNEGGNSR